MARAPVLGAVHLALGVVLAVVGFALVGWTVLAFVNEGKAEGMATWVAESSPWPLPFGLSAPKAGYYAVQHEVAFIVGFVALLMSWTGYSFLKSARIMLMPKAMSDDGFAILELARPAHVGGTLEGSLALSKTPREGERQTLRLRCDRTFRKGVTRTDEDGDQFTTTEKVSRTIHSQDVRVRPVRGERSWILPFRFEIPADLPPTPDSARARRNWAAARWYFEVVRPWYRSNTHFDIQVAAGSPDVARPFKPVVSTVAE